MIDTNDDRLREVLLYVAEEDCIDPQNTECDCVVCKARTLLGIDVDWLRRCEQELKRLEDSESRIAELKAMRREEMRSVIGFTTSIVD